jgi:hypothetical protein
MFGILIEILDLLNIQFVKFNKLKEPTVLVKIKILFRRSTMKRLFCIICYVTLLTTISLADTVNVPGDQPTIQAGINVAVDGDTVLVTDGTYFENINYKGKAITVASHYFVDSDTSHISNTIIDGSSPSHVDSGSVVFFVSGEDTSSVLYGITITKGTGTITQFTWNNAQNAVRAGGGIFCFNSGPRILYNKILNNNIPDFDDTFGGGVSGYSRGNLTHLILQGNEIINNTVSGNDVNGGGVFLWCDGTIINNVISYNMCSAGDHAFSSGVSCWSELSDTHTVVIKNNHITHNVCKANNHALGGGVYIEGGIKAFIINNQISYNEVTGSTTSRGAGICMLEAKKTYLVDRNIVSYNNCLGSSTPGGGMYHSRCGNILITNNIILGNSGDEGGGIRSGGSNVQIINNTIINNKASYRGAGIRVSSGQPVVINTILWNNQSYTDPQVSGAILAFHSNIQDSVWMGENNISADPLFADTLFHLSDNSPCIARGIDSILLEGEMFVAPTTDIDSNARPNPPGSRPDIGAMENSSGIPPDYILVPDFYPTIQAGIDAAENNDVVLVADGTYFENINYKGKAITVASHYFVDSDTSHVSNTIIDGSSPNHADSGSVVFFVSGEDSTSVLFGFTITKGTGTITESTWENDVYLERIGGGILCYNSGARISYNKIINNNVSSYNFVYGGGIAGSPNGSTALVIIESNQIVYNTVTGDDDVAGSGVTLYSNGTLINNVISHNTSTSNGNANGGIMCWSYPEPRTVMIKNNKITHNINNGNDYALGGGVSIQFSMNGSVIGNEISYNELNAATTGRGGGIHVVFMTGKTVIDRNTISHNIVNCSTSTGGGIALYDNNTINSNTLILNNVISGNSAAQGGGIRSKSSISQIINNTIVNNKSSYRGAGIRTSGTKPVVINSILWNNQSSTDPQISGSIIVAFSNIQDSVWAGENNISANPLFADTLFHLSDSSKCIGKGINSIEINDITYSAPGADFEGNSRPNPIDELVDIGALESPYPGLPTGTVASERVTSMKFTLFQNYPNPFNPTTTISYQLPVVSFVELIIYNIKGQKVASVVSEQQAAGSYHYEWNVEDELASGVYIYRLSTEKFTAFHKLLLLK